MNTLNNYTSIWMRNIYMKQWNQQLNLYTDINACFCNGFALFHSPLDVLEEAQVSVHVKHRRLKRSNTNFLSNILDSINWRENSNTTLKLNRNMESFSILKTSNYPEPTVGIQNEHPDQETETEFNFTCFSCIGTVGLSYHLWVQSFSWNNQLQMHTLMKLQYGYKLYRF